MGKTIKAWALVDKETGEICHYDDDREIVFNKYKKDLEGSLDSCSKKYYKIIRIEIKELNK